MGWHGRLELTTAATATARQPTTATTAAARAAAALPEGPAICHHVLVHPPGGMVERRYASLIALRLGEGQPRGDHQPGAARFYCSGGERAAAAERDVAAGASAEWLPLETIAYSGCVRAVNHLRFDLAPGAEMLGRDVLALGLPPPNSRFVRGRYRQHIEDSGPLGWSAARSPPTMRCCSIRRSSWPAGA